ncbi:hypothetical protein BCR32DRAFT_244400 [Anaeromyces robustus]|uniref:Uncharacterized protein n=1 Tax=Anaeromyces robustus TaxID=1754192 RepID=A0A1Y1X9Q1_9FUNG|nr:hypothetical protein BCR32DRAFT_244400 [Anaeromyces robustus]|eukprot:ORX82146.1 hypothetical protein BCR32DRAFT_244400 [Anaeromyces robustus]
MNSNVENSNYPLTLDGLPSFQSQKSINNINNNQNNENINPSAHAQPNIIITSPGIITSSLSNTTVIADAKLHAFTRFRYSNELRKKYEDHLEKTNHSEKELNIALNKLRNMIYEYGLPDGSEVMNKKNKSFKF